MNATQMIYECSGVFILQTYECTQKIYERQLALKTYQRQAGHQTYQWGLLIFPRM